MSDDTTRIADYAAAVLDIGRAEGDATGVIGELAQVARAFEGSEELMGTLRDPLVPLDRKKGVIDDLLGAKAAKATVSIVDLLVAMDRVSDLGDIADKAFELAAAAESAIVAQVRTAAELDDATRERLAARLAEKTGKNVQLDVAVDESLIGGVVVRVGDTIYDGSVKGRLADLRETWG